MSRAPRALEPHAEISVELLVAPAQRVDIEWIDQAEFESAANSCVNEAFAQRPLISAFLVSQSMDREVARRLRAFRCDDKILESRNHARNVKTGCPKGPVQMIVRERSAAHLQSIDRRRPTVAP